jgi:SAM-dependent methyltransferase
MNPYKFSAIAHRHHDFCNPIHLAKIDRLLALLPFDAGARALDLGCGRGELALRLIGRVGCHVTAVDLSAAMLDAARERAEQASVLDHVHFIEADIAEITPEAEAFDLTAMLGGGGIAGGIQGVCTRLAGWTRRGGYVLIGEGYWRRPPSPEYLAHLEATEDEFRDHRGNVQAGIDAGLVPLHASVASADDWDEYEWKYSASIERYAIEQPDDADVPAMLARIRRWRDGYLRWGRDTLGFGLYLFHRPVKPM